MIYTLTRNLKGLKAKSKAQSILEAALLFGVVVAAFSAMFVYCQRSASSRLATISNAIEDRPVEIDCPLIPPP